MNTFTVTKTLKQTYHVKDIDGYSFCSDKKLYNLKTGNEIKQTVNGGSYGYWIQSKFYTLKRLKPLLVRPKRFDCPF